MQSIMHAAPWWPYVVVAWVGVYFVVLIFLSAGIRRLPYSTPRPPAGCMTVSVIVSARNEARDLPVCLASLLAQDYPPQLLQIILVDDHSTDETGALVDAAAAAHAHVIALHSADLPRNGLEAKARGIAHGIHAATGEWVLITDADAAVHPEWARRLLGRVTANTGMVGGALVVRSNGSVGIVERMSWGFLQLFNTGMAGWGLPFVCLGPNMGIRRDVYVSAGGLEAASFRVAEDLALFQMVQRRKLGIQVYMDAESTATLAPVPSARHLLSQHRRWLGGGIGQGPAYAVLLGLAILWASGILLYMLVGWRLGGAYWLAFLAAKALLDARLLAMQQRRMRLTEHVRFWWVLQLYHIALIGLLPPSFLFTRRIAWRGTGYTVEYS